jgi:hypothetical protein
MNKIQESASKANSFTSAEGSGENAHQTESPLRYLSLIQHCPFSIGRSQHSLYQLSEDEVKGKVNTSQSFLINY